MEVKIENMVFGWHEELPEMFIELLNTPRPMFGEQITDC